MNRIRKLILSVRRLYGKSQNMRDRLELVYKVDTDLQVYFVLSLNLFYSQALNETIRSD